MCGAQHALVVTGGGRAGLAVRHPEQPTCSGLDGGPGDGGFAGVTLDRARGAARLHLQVPLSCPVLLCPARPIAVRGRVAPHLSQYKNLKLAMNWLIRWRTQSSSSK